MTTTAMKRAGQLVAHLDILHQISDVRQLLLLQLAMRERQDQVALFKRQDGAVTLSLIGTQLSAPSGELSHRAGNAQAAGLLTQLQDISGIRGDDVAFSSGQIQEMIAAQTRRIEASEELARLDAALLGLVGKLEQEQQAAEVQAAVTPEMSAAGEAVVEETSGAVADQEEEAGSAQPDQTQAEDTETGFSAVRPSRRRSA